MFEMLKNQNTWMKNEVVDFTRELVRTPSVSLQEGKVADLVEAKMKELGFDQVVRDDAGNVVGILFGRESTPTVLLNSHMDTVPADEEANTAESVRDHLDDTRIYGNGACDCKGGLAAQIFAASLLKRSYLPLRGNIVVAATVAEENGCSLGVKTLMDKTLPELEIKPDYAVLGEPTNLGLYYGHDGWVEMEIKVEGANSFQVDDAARAIVDDFNNQYQKPESLVQDFQINQPHFQDMKGYRRATIRLGKRLSPQEEVEKLVGDIKHSAALVANSTASVALEVMVREDEKKLYTGRRSVAKYITHAWTTDPFCPLIERSRQALAASGCVVKPGKWTLGRLGMGTAGSVLVKNYNVPTVGYGPGLEDLAHTAEESVEIEKLTQAVYGTAVIAHSLVGVPVCGWTSDEI